MWSVLETGTVVVRCGTVDVRLFKQKPRTLLRTMEVTTSVVLTTVTKYEVGTTVLGRCQHRRLLLTVTRRPNTSIPRELEDLSYVRPPSTRELYRGTTSKSPEPSIHPGSHWRERPRYGNVVEIHQRIQSESRTRTLRSSRRHRSWRPQVSPLHLVTPRECWRRVTLRRDLRVD